MEENVDEKSNRALFESKELPKKQFLHWNIQKLKNYIESTNKNENGELVANQLIVQKIDFIDKLVEEIICTVTETFKTSKNDELEACLTYLSNILFMRKGEHILEHTDEVCAMTDSFFSFSNSLAKSIIDLRHNVMETDLFEPESILKRLMSDSYSPSSLSLIEITNHLVVARSCYNLHSSLNIHSNILHQIDLAVFKLISESRKIIRQIVELGEKRKQKINTAGKRKSSGAQTEIEIVNIWKELGPEWIIRNGKEKIFYDEEEYSLSGFAEKILSNQYSIGLSTAQKTLKRLREIGKI